MKKCYKKVAKAIEKLQKAKADAGEPQNPRLFKALHAMRQTKEIERR